MKCAANDKAVEAVRKWRFKPGTRHGKPVAVPATVEIKFRPLCGTSDRPALGTLADHAILPIWQVIWQVFCRVCRVTCQIIAEQNQRVNHDLAGLAGEI